DAVRGTGPGAGGDPLRDLADGLLDGLAEVARLEARTAALKVQLAADYARAARFLAPPAGSVRDRAVQEMALVAEVACVLTVSERTAGALLSEARALTTALPLTWAALRAGTISWQHARILVEETSGLDSAGAASLEGHFLDPAAPGAARGCAAVLGGECSLLDNAVGDHRDLLVCGMSCLCLNRVAWATSSLFSQSN
ncbi:DUF222 domain-containing protein, partial [Streptomyces violaceolatus]|uniref:DUF222 domain-containing protein n=1 Tax=Streptomyces violaceolatus TaxID=67378 RepID=UPI0031E1CD67